MSGTPTSSIVSPHAEAIFAPLAPLPLVDQARVFDDPHHPSQTRSDPSGGDTSTNDNGLTAALDLMTVAIGGNTVTYNFDVDKNGDKSLIPPHPRAKISKNRGWQSFNNSTKNRGIA